MKFRPVRIDEKPEMKTPTRAGQRRGVFDDIELYGV